MESQTIYYTGSPGVGQDAQVIRTGSQFVQASPTAREPTQNVYYATGGQQGATAYYQPQSQPQQTCYSPQAVQPVQYTSTSPQIYTVGASLQQQQQPTQAGIMQGQQPLYSPQQPTRVLYASPAPAQPSAGKYQPQNQISQATYQPPPPPPPQQQVQYASSQGAQYQPQANPPYQVQQSQPQQVYVSSYQPQQAQTTAHQIQLTPAAQYQPQQKVYQTQIQPTPYQGQQMAYQQEQTRYQPMQAAQPQVIRIGQAQQQLPQYTGAAIDRGAHPAPVEANQQPAVYQPMGKAAPTAMAPPLHQQPQQYQPPQQRDLQSVAAQQRVVPLQQQQQQQRPQQPTYTGGTPSSPSDHTPKLRQLHSKSTVFRQPRRSMDRGDVEGPPQFVQHPVPQETVKEGDGVTLKAIVKPAGDPTLDVQWLKNGVVLTASSRHNAILDRGYAEFQFLYTNTTDSGEYVCVAKTAHGSAQSTSCTVTIVPDESVVTDSQLPEESMIMNLAAMESQLAMNGTPRREEEVKFTNPPKFMRQLFPQIGLKENESAKFETFVQPANDPSLTVEWFKDGEPLKTGCRFTETMDRGYAILDIHYTYPEDSGMYHCVAKNNAGSATSNVVELTCKGGTGVVTDSVLSAESVNYLRSLDAVEISTTQDHRYTETEQQAAPPVFELEPKNTTAIEGSPVRLLVKAGGFPHPRVQWLINGDVLPTSGGGGAWRIYNDGGISCLEFNRCGPPGEYTVTAIAKNNLGEATSECNLVIDPQPDYRPDLKHVAPDNPFRRMASLKRVERSDELKSAFEKTKPKVLELRKLERRSSQSEGLNDTEMLYAQVQASLRSNRRSLQGPPPKLPQQTPQYTAAPPAPKPQPPQPAPQNVSYSQQQPQTTMVQPQRQPTQTKQPPPKQAPPPPPPPPPPSAAPVPPQLDKKLQYGFGNVANEQPNNQYSVTETSAEFQIEL
uniref:Titin n=1 Tax=Mesocestoides corti TaxID=53468 RepID=A0A5K3FFF5_MESCO